MANASNAGHNDRQQNRAQRCFRQGGAYHLEHAAAFAVGAECAVLGGLEVGQGGDGGIIPHDRVFIDR